MPGAILASWSENLTTDVQIAAHAIEYSGEVYSNERDFGRLEGVKWVNPLRESMER